MRKKYCRLTFVIIGSIYSIGLFTAYALDVFFLKWSLALPWSLITTFLSPLLAHMGGAFSEIDLIIGAALNLMLFLRFAIVRITSLDD
jgi:hypothetical protein